MPRGGRKPGSQNRSSAKLRVGEEIRMKLSQLILRELDDPRLDGIHLTRVEMTPDLAVARVFWRATPRVSPVAPSGVTQAATSGASTDAAAEGSATKAMVAAGPFLRRQLGRTLRLKHVPQLEFRLDAMVDSGARIEDLLAGLAASRTARPAERDDEE